MTPFIVVVGSSNTDMVIKAEYLPAPGETVLGGRFFMNAGGKGANQAVAAARLGGSVSFVAKIGDDIFGQEAIQLFKKEDINTTYVFTDNQYPSGVALINVDKHGENCITVASGANAALLKEDIETARTDIQQASIVLTQLETPLSTVEYLSSLTKEAGVQFILNPAPACELPDSLLRSVSILTPNENELAMLTGSAISNTEDVKKAVFSLHQRGVETVIVTMGKEGALVSFENTFHHVATPVVEAVDTTAAGDVFNGALAVALAEGKNVLEATHFACSAAAISVTRLGAQASAPYRHEITDPVYTKTM